MTEPVEFVVEAAPDPADVASLDEGVHDDMLAKAGLSEESAFAVFVREGDRVRAGIHGSTWGGCCELHSLWVEPESRGQGVGRALLAAAEEEARRRGCTQVLLFSHEIQSPWLYLRRGYEVVGRVDDYPEGSAALWFRKPLAPDSDPGETS